MVLSKVVVPSDASAGGSFGYSLSLSGDTLLVGACGEESSEAYVFERSEGTWTERQKLIPSD